MNASKETLIKVVTLILISIVPTCVLHLALSKFIGEAGLQGQFMGYTVHFTGPTAFYIFMILLFRKWATLEPKGTAQIAQEEIGAMSNDEKTRLLYDIEANIQILNTRRELLTGQLSVGIVPPLQIDLQTIRNL